MLASGGGGLVADKAICKLETGMASTPHVYEVRPRKDHVAK
jgi:hypothetical protein